MIRRSVFLILLFLTLAKISFGQEPQQVTYRKLPATHVIHNSAQIGSAATVSIFGYATKYALVFLDSTINLGTTLAKDDGSFRFDHILVPEKTSEICLSYNDGIGRASSTTCIPFSSSYNGYDIGPILLSPTIGLNNATEDLGESLVIQGFSVPKQPVTLYSFSDSVFSWTDLISPKKAYAIPPFTTMADENGHYEYTLTTQDAQDMRLYSNNSVEDSSSDRSIQLKAEILPYWIIQIQKVILLLKAIFGEVKNVILLSELLILYLVICYYFLPKKHKDLLIRHASLLVSTPRSLAIKNTAMVKRMVSNLLRR